MGSDADPAWLKLHGARRVAAEYKQLFKAFQKGKLPFVKEMTVDGDQMTTWRLQLCNFDDDVPGGRQLNEDVANLKKK
jgi:hypothetical protein